MSGTVYFIRAVGTDLVKIGYTERGAWNRLDALQTGCPHILIVEATIRAAASAERKVHDYFRQWRFRGEEWFKIPSDDLMRGLNQLGRVFKFYDVANELRATQWEITGVEAQRLLDGDAPAEVIQGR